jgi:hypothetical protein
MGTLRIATVIFIASLPVLVSCHSMDGKEARNSGLQQPPHPIIDTVGRTIFQRFRPPEGFFRTPADSASFAYYLRHLPLRTFGTPVRYYDGRQKNKRDVYISVVDMDIGNRDLQQCADAIMRLRAEYLYGIERYRDIHFTFVSDGQPRYYEEYNEGDHSYTKFRSYMDYVFSYANTRSLYGELISLDSLDDMQIGDVYIQTGIPYGHAVIVVDMARNNVTGETVYLLAQSYMPAQDIQILTNRADRGISPWYRLEEGPVNTPEWTFGSGDLKRFRD